MEYVYKYNQFHSLQDVAKVRDIYTKLQRDKTSMSNNSLTINFRLSSVECTSLSRETLTYLYITTTQKTQQNSLFHRQLSRQTTTMRSCITTRLSVKVVSAEYQRISQAHTKHHGRSPCLWLALICLFSVSPPQFKVK